MHSSTQHVSPALTRFKDILYSVVVQQPQLLAILLYSLLQKAIHQHNQKALPCIVVHYVKLHSEGMYLLSSFCGTCCNWIALKLLMCFLNYTLDHWKEVCYPSGPLLLLCFTKYRIHKASLQIVFIHLQQNDVRHFYPANLQSLKILYT